MAKGKGVDPRTARASERWRKIVGDWRRSGLSVREFCRGRGVSRCSLYAWRRRLEGEAGTEGQASGRQAGKPAFVPVRVVARGAPAAGIEIQFPSGHVLRAGPEVKPEALERTVALLDSSRCPDVPKHVRSGRC